MNPEPLYEYKKGEGWVARSNAHVVTTKCGKLVRLENRPPRKGEHYDCGGKGERWGNQENPNWEEWESWFSTRKYSSCVATSDRLVSRGDVYITLVPL